MDAAGLAAAAGYDYMESGVDGFLKPREGEDAFRAQLALWKTSPVPLRALNCFIPGDLKICSPVSPVKELYAYAETALRRAGAAGIQTIVFGSGGARSIPEGYDRDRANEQLLAFCRFCAGQAERAGVTIALEPLNSKECNVITTVAEGAQLVRAVNHPSFRLLVDCYHWGVENEPHRNISDNGSLFAHVHTATWPARLALGQEDCAIDAFFATLCKTGYDGNVSLECKLGDKKAEEVKTALRVMREAVATAVSAV